jgi:hypothetical protein
MDRDWVDVPGLCRLLPPHLGRARRAMTVCWPSRDAGGGRGP